MRVYKINIFIEIEYKSFELFPHFLDPDSLCPK
jgi:hypothetical protein